MELIDTREVPFDRTRAVVWPLASGEHGCVRLIKLAPGQVLPAHTHDSSDVFLFVAEGAGMLRVDDRDVAFPTGTLARYQGDEELAVRNPTGQPLTVVVFFSPAFPPRQS